MDAFPFSIETYLSAQIREIVSLGPQNVLTWAPKADTGRWLQVSVQQGDSFYLMVQVLAPIELPQQHLDNIFDEIGWIRHQTGESECLVYYIEQHPSLSALFQHADKAAERCACAMELLWRARCVEQIVLLSAHGPQLVERRRKERAMAAEHNEVFAA